jgi:trehalose 6-phosphate phosphatase
MPVGYSVVGMDPDLLTKLEAIARTPVLLVASDFDGTLSPLVDDPPLAEPEERCIRALAAFARLDHTHAAIVSGRGLNDLQRLSGAPDGVLMVGSHGAEHGAPSAAQALADQLRRLGEQLEAIADTRRGFRLELKPFAVAFHYRAAETEDAARAVASILAGPAAQPGVKAIHGSKVLELAVSDASKAAALSRLRYETGATSLVFLGDDPSDEDAIRSLGQTDLGIRVGAADTRAHGRTPDVDGVAKVLESLLDLRRAWLKRRQLVPIEQLSILSDQRTVAVVDPRGRIVWSCVPRVDSSAIFAELLGGPAAGSFEIAPPTGGAPQRQHYDGDSFLLITDWGTFRTLDYLDTSGGRAYQRAGRGDLVRVIEGEGEALIRFAPRLDFGRVPTRLRLREAGLEVEGSPDPIVLYAPGVNWNIRDEGPHQVAEATVRLDGKPIALEMRFGSGNLQESPIPEPERRQQNLKFWQGWAGSLRLPPLHQAAVKRSALVLKALCHGPTGSFVAAATTSLPEHLGGVRNWDYRFCWPRDASLSAAALVRLGNTGHALKLLDWILGVVDSCESPDRLHPIYTVAGGRLPPEADLGHLAGYADSKPVRISNAAAYQVQLDVFGPIVDLVALLAERGAPISPEHWRLVRAMVAAVDARWREPDHGIWEIRAERRHHVHSRVMCWHTIERALKVEEYVTGRRNSDWVRIRDEIRDDVLANAWSEKLGSFCSAYGRDTLDASVLLIGLCGLVPPTDQRFVRTVAAIDERLRQGPVVIRYFDDDGLPGREGGMLICAGWLIEALHLVGRTADATALLEQIVALVGPTGMAAEQYCPRYKLALGNIAQAYSHLAIINASIALSRQPAGAV